MQTFWALGGDFLKYVCMDGKVCEGGKGENEVWKQCEGKMKDGFTVSDWYTEGVKREGKNE